MGLRLTHTQRIWPTSRRGGDKLALDVASERSQETGHRVLRDLTRVFRDLGCFRLDDDRLGVLDPLLETLQIVGKVGALDFLETLTDLVGEEVVLLRVEELSGLHLQLLGSLLELFDLTLAL